MKFELGKAYKATDGSTYLLVADIWDIAKKQKIPLTDKKHRYIAIEIWGSHISPELYTSIPSTFLDDGTCELDKSVRLLSNV